MSYVSGHKATIQRYNQEKREKITQKTRSAMGYTMLQNSDHNSNYLHSKVNYKIFVMYVHHPK